MCKSALTHNHERDDLSNSFEGGICNWSKIYFLFVIPRSCPLCTGL